MKSEKPYFRKKMRNLLKKSKLKKLLYRDFKTLE